MRWPVARRGAGFAKPYPEQRKSSTSRWSIPSQESVGSKYVMP